MGSICGQKVRFKHELERTNVAAIRKRKRWSRNTSSAFLFFLINKCVFIVISIDNDIEKKYNHCKVKNDFK